MPAVTKKSSDPAQADSATVKNTAITKAVAPADKIAAPAKNAALVAVAAAMAATAAGAAPQKYFTDGQKPKRWIVKKTLSKFKANLDSVPDYYLPKFIQLVAAEVAPRCDGDQQLSRSEQSKNFIIFILAAVSNASGTSSIHLLLKRRKMSQAGKLPRFN
jgi:hypothetical protein